MAFKRRTKRGGGGDRKSTTFNTDGKGTTRSYSSSSTGKQRTGSGGTRTTTTLRSDGRITKTITRHGANGYISRKSKTTGGNSKTTVMKPSISSYKYKSPKIRNVLSTRRGSTSRSYRSTARRGEIGDPIAALTLLAGIAGIYFVIVYWKIILSVIGVGFLLWFIYEYNKD